MIASSLYTIGCSSITVPQLSILYDCFRSLRNPIDTGATSLLTFNSLWLLPPWLPSGLKKLIDCFQFFMIASYFIELVTDKGLLNFQFFMIASCLHHQPPGDFPHVLFQFFMIASHRRLIVNSLQQSPSLLSILYDCFINRLTAPTLPASQGLSILYDCFQCR